MYRQLRAIPGTVRTQLTPVRPFIGVCSHVFAQAAGINSPVLAAFLTAPVRPKVGMDPRVNLEFVSPRETRPTFVAPVWLLTCVLPDVSIEVFVVVSDEMTVLHWTRLLFVDAVMHHQCLLGVGVENVCFAVHSRQVLWGHSLHCLSP